MNPPLRNLVLGVVRLRCPICLEGKVFRGLFAAHRCCENCGYYFSRESGYFLGSFYLGYSITIVVAFLVWFVLGYLAGMGWSPARLAILVAIVAFFPVWFHRYSRLMWVAIDLYLNPPVQEDFQSRGR